jgi:hypothetical protein
VAEHRLDVLAGAEEVRREVGAAAAVVRGVERAQRDPVRLRRGGGHLVVAVEALTSTPLDLEELRTAARLAPAPLLLPLRRGRFRRPLLLRPRLTEEEQRHSGRVRAAALAATTARAQAVTAPEEARSHDAAAIGDGGVGPRRGERGPGHPAGKDGLASRCERLLRERAVNDVGGQAIEDVGNGGSTGGDGHGRLLG